MDHCIDMKKGCRIVPAKSGINEKKSKVHLLICQVAGT